MTTLQEVIDTRQLYYLEMQVEKLLLLNEMEPINENQWLALHYMQFNILLLSDERSSQN